MSFLYIPLHTAAKKLQNSVLKEILESHISWHITFLQSSPDLTRKVYTKMACDCHMTYLDMGVC